MAGRIRIPEAGDAIRLFDPSFVPGRTPPGPVDLYARLTAEPGRLTFEDIRGQIGPTVLAGTVGLRLAGARPRIEAEIQAGEIEADRYRPTTARPTGPVPTLPGRSPFPTDPLPFDWLRAAEGRLALTVAGVRWGGTRITDAAVTATLADGVLTVEPFDGRIHDGRIGVTGRIAAGDGVRAPEVSGTIRLVDVAVAADDAPLAAPDRLLRIADARADLDARLSARGSNPAALVAALSGTADVRLRDGVVEGVDIKGAADRLGSLEDPREILGVVTQALGGGRTPFGRLTASFTVQDGVARTQNLVLDAPIGSVRGTGTIDLARWATNLTTTVTLPGGGLPFSVTFTGPLDAPLRAPDVSGLQTDLVTRLQQELLRRLAPAPAVAAPVPEARPEAPPPETPPEAPPETPPETPQTPAAPAAEPSRPPDVIRDLLRGLLR